MTAADQIKILDRKIKQNEAQYDLDRKVAKISPLSSENLDKYEYLTGEDLDLNVDYDKLSFVGGNKKVYGLDSFTTFEKLMKDIRNKSRNSKAEIKQSKFAEKLDELRVYPARRSKYIDLKESVFENAKNFVTDGKKLFMCLKAKYYHSLKRVVQKLIIVINNQIF